jgi:DNA repair protein RecO (recombination protein O)
MMKNRWPRSDILMQARITDQTAFVMRRREWRNTSLIVDLFTLDYGCVSALAKGARQSVAKSGYQPFVPLQVSWTGQQELKTLTSVDSYNLPVDEHNYLALLYINELIISFVPRGEANPEVFQAYLKLLHLAETRLEPVSLRLFELELVSSQGYFPDVSQDAESSEPIQAEAYYQFVIGSGFIGCEEAAVDSVKGQLIIDWIEQRYDQDNVCRLAKSVLRSTIDFNLHGKTLKSRDVSREIMRRK